MAFDAVFVGLGNPGARYAMTRHNVGFIALDVLAQELRSRFETDSTAAKKYKAHLTELEWDGQRLLLMKPQTFMNLSGESVRALYERQSDLKTKPLIVFQDEVDIPFGRVRVKLGGGDAGHNGLRSLRACLGHGDFYRIRMGVGKPPTGSSVQLADHVLMPFRRDEQDTLISLVEGSLAVASTLLKEGLAKAQERAAKV